jgi:hypothetical protein
MSTDLFKDMEIVNVTWIVDIDRDGSKSEWVELSFETSTHYHMATNTCVSIDTPWDQLGLKTWDGKPLSEKVAEAKAQPMVQDPSNALVAQTTHQ